MIHPIPTKQMMHVFLTVVLTLGATATLQDASPIANLEPNSRMAAAVGRAEQLCWHHGMGPALVCDKNIGSSSAEMAVASDQQENPKAETSQIRLPDFLLERLFMHLSSTPCPILQYETLRATQS